MNAGYFHRDDGNVMIFILGMLFACVVFALGLAGLAMPTSRVATESRKKADLVAKTEAGTATRILRQLMANPSCANLTPGTPNNTITTHTVSVAADNAGAIAADSHYLRVDCEMISSSAGGGAPDDARRFGAAVLFAPNGADATGDGQPGLKLYAAGKIQFGGDVLAYQKPCFAEASFGLSTYGQCMSVATAKTKLASASTYGYLQPMVLLPSSAGNSGLKTAVCPDLDAGLPFNIQSLDSSLAQLPATPAWWQCASSPLPASGWAKTEVNYGTGPTGYPLPSKRGPDGQPITSPACSPAADATCSPDGSYRLVCDSVTTAYQQYDPRTIGIARDDLTYKPLTYTATMPSCLRIFPPGAHASAPLQNGIWVKACPIDITNLVDPLFGDKTPYNALCRAGNPVVPPVDTMTKSIRANIFLPGVHYFTNDVTAQYASFKVFDFNVKFVDSRWHPNIDAPIVAGTQPTVLNSSGSPVPDPNPENQTDLSKRCVADTNGGALFVFATGKGLKYDSAQPYPHVDTSICGLGANMAATVGTRTGVAFYQQPLTPTGANATVTMALDQAANPIVFGSSSAPAGLFEGGRMYLNGTIFAPRGRVTALIGTRNGTMVFSSGIVAYGLTVHNYSCFQFAELGLAFLDLLSPAYPGRCQIAGQVLSDGVTGSTIKVFRLTMKKCPMAGSAPIKPCVRPLNGNPYSGPNQPDYTTDSIANPDVYAELTVDGTNSRISRWAVRDNRTDTPASS